MTAKWYEMPALLDRGTVAEAIAANGGNRSAAAADLVVRKYAGAPRQREAT